MNISDAFKEARCNLRDALELYDALDQISELLVKKDGSKIPYDVRIIGNQIWITCNNDLDFRAVQEKVAPYLGGIYSYEIVLNFDATLPC